MLLVTSAVSEELLIIILQAIEVVLADFATWPTTAQLPYTILILVIILI